MDNILARFFLSIYHGLSRSKWLAWTLMLVSFAVFAFYASKVEFEEDISKLLPESDSESYASLAFNDLKVKDKIFIQLVPRDSLSKDEFTEYLTDFAMRLKEADSATHYIDNMLYTIDDDVKLSAIDYLTMYLPTFIDTTLYTRFDSILTPENIDYRMMRNHQLLFEEGRESLADLVTTDPVGLRFAFLADSAFNIDAFSSGFTTIFLSPNFSSMNSKTGTDLVKLIEHERDEFRQEHPDVEILFHGAPVQSVFNSRQIKHDLLFTIGISLLIICIVIWLCFRGWTTLPLLITPVIYGTAFALACVYWLQGGMSLMAIGIGAIVLGVALSYVLHVLTHYKHVNDPVQVLREQSKPVCLGCLTTVGAFVGLLFTESSLLRDFGIFASIALIGATLFSLIFLPHFFTARTQGYSAKAFSIIDNINSKRYDNKFIVIALTVITIVCLFTSRYVGFDSDLKNIGYYEPSVMRSRDIYNARANHGHSSQFYAVSATTLDSALYFNRALLAAADSLVRSGAAYDYSKLSSVLVPEDVQQERIAAWQAYWTPERVSEVMSCINRSGAKHGFEPGTFDMFEAIISSDYEPGSLYDEQILPDGLMSNIVEEVNGNYLVFTSIEMDRENMDSINNIIASLPHAVVIDPFYYTNDMVRMLNDDFNIVLWISSLFVFIVLILSFRKLSHALLAFLPMVASWYIVQGIMGIFGLEFNLINIIISTFIFGIGVDYSIFIMDGLIAGTRSDNQLLSHHKTAIFLSAFVLVVVVTSLLFASHPAIRSIGVSTLIGMLSTVLISYSVQPFLFRYISKWRI